MILNSLIMTGEKSIEVTSFTTAEQNYHLSRINSMMDSWSNERLMIYQIQLTSFALTASDGTYTIGNGADFNMTRPIRIVNPCFTRDSDDIDIPINIIDADTYGRIVDKTLGDTTPVYMYYDAGFSATSTGTIQLYPLPTTGLTLYLSTLQPLQTFASVTTNLLLPPGYQDAIESNYAVRASMGVTPVSPELMAFARATKAAIKTTNLTAPIMSLDPGAHGSGGYSILTGP